MDLSYQGRHSWMFPVVQRVNVLQVIRRLGYEASLNNSLNQAQSSVERVTGDLEIKGQIMSNPMKPTRRFSCKRRDSSANYEHVGPTLYPKRRQTSWSKAEWRSGEG